MTEQEKQAMIDAMNNDKNGKGQRRFWTLDSNFEGTKPIRILPPLKNLGEVKFYFSHKVHWIGGVPYEDLEQTIFDHEGKVIHESETDPVQKFVKKLYRTSERNSDEWKLASDLNSKQRYISRIVVRNPADTNIETTPVFYEYGPTIYDMLFQIITATDFGNIVDPKNGRDYNLAKKGKGRQSKYEMSSPSANITSIFTNPEKLKLVFENAMTMKYTDLIEFKSYEEIDEALKDHLGLSKGTTVTSNVEIAGGKVVRENNEPSRVANPVESADDSEIDDILNDFV